MIETTILGLLTPELLQQVQGPYVYILSTNDDVMYIGQTNDFQRRFWDFYNTVLYSFKMEDEQDVLGWKQGFFLYPFSLESLPRIICSAGLGYSQK